MKQFTKLLSSVLILLQTLQMSSQKSDFTIAFGSCNNQRLPNPFWNDLNRIQPNVWIWGGDNIYADTKNMRKMQRFYEEVTSNTAYGTLQKNTAIEGTWDDHDYGQNDAGKHYTQRAASQQLFLDFLGVPKNDSRRNRAGIYYSKQFKHPKGSVKIICLDTRYFRDDLTPGTHGHRYGPSSDPDKSILGSAQWEWLTEELLSTTDTFTFIVTSIQFLSSEHGFEKWANFPQEVKRLHDLIEKARNTRVVLLSGDRHISEFSVYTSDKLPYPLIDFTSSGLTHAYTKFKGEPNTYRKGKVIHERSYGLISIDFDRLQLRFSMNGIEQKKQQEFTQIYP